ncbi:VOC family protein [Chitinophaga solisilvae]|uniref:VOC family protein n=1 Tax=Chitinophaga solisilvae TaxID=1233460 RepID=UPI00136ED68A|nr:VOC family protein [Chitinophaga solisilvae]
MQLNHLNLSVRDVAASRTFFETYLGFTSADTKPNDTLAVLNGPGDFILVLMHQRLNENGNSTYPDSFHIGFYLPGDADVLATYQRLQDGGIPLPQAPQKIRRTFGFYFHYDDIMIEIATASFS